jgi:hypothetical protein
MPADRTADASDSAVFPAVDQAFQHLRGIVEPILQAEAHVESGVGILQPDELPAFLRVQRQGLFAEDMDSQLRGVFGDGQMQIMGQTDMHHIRLHIMNHGFVVRIKRDIFRSGASSAFLNIADARQRDLRVLSDGCDMHWGNHAHSDDSCFFHRASFLVFLPGAAV